MIVLNFKLGPIFQEGPKNLRSNLSSSCLSLRWVSPKQTKFSAHVSIKEKSCQFKMWWLVCGLDFEGDCSFTCHDNFDFNLKDLVCLLTNHFLCHPYHRKHLRSIRAQYPLSVAFCSSIDIYRTFAFHMNPKAC